MAHHDSSANCFLNDLIRLVDQRSHNGSDSTDENVSEMFNRDPTTTV